MRGKYYDSATLVFKSLEKKKDLKIVHKVDAPSRILILTGAGTPKSNDLGNGSWGKIDFLRRIGVPVEYIDEFPKIDNKKKLKL
jgi:hypothetical protein